MEHKRQYRELSDETKSKISNSTRGRGKSFQHKYYSEKRRAKGNKYSHDKSKPDEIVRKVVNKLTHLAPPPRQIRYP